MMFFILFNYTILRDSKDTLVVSIPGGGAECISFLKAYCVTPCAVLFMIIFVKLSHSFSRERVFYIIVGSFCLFFGIFAFVIYPNKEIFCMSLETIQKLQAAYPKLYWVFPILGNPPQVIFVLGCEMYGTYVLSLLYWQFANESTKVKEAKRFYGLFGMIGNLGLVFSGPTVILCGLYAKSQALQNGMDTFGLNLKILMTIVCAFCVFTMLIYRWMQKNVLTDPQLYQPSESASSHKEKKQQLSVKESLAYIMRNPYFLLLATIVISYGLAINLIEGVWKSQIKIAFPDKNDYNMFMGQFSSWTGIVTIFLMIIGNNVLRRLSWLKAAIITPIMVLGTSIIFFSVVWFGQKTSPFTLFMGIKVVMIAVCVGMIQNVLSKGTKYSLFDATKQMTYIPLTKEERTSGQAAVEVVGGRGGKSIAAFMQSIMLCTVGGGGASLPSLTKYLAPIVIVICGAWIYAVVRLDKRFAALVEKKKKEDKTEEDNASSSSSKAAPLESIANT